MIIPRRPRRRFDRRTLPTVEVRESSTSNRHARRRCALKGAADSGHQPWLASGRRTGNYCGQSQLRAQDPEDLEDDWLHYINSPREIPEFCDATLNTRRGSWTRTSAGRSPPRSWASASMSSRPGPRKGSVLPVRSAARNLGCRRTGHRIQPTPLNPSGGIASTVSTTAATHPSGRRPPRSSPAAGAWKRT